MFHVAPAARVIDQDVAHHLRRHREKVRPILPINILRARQPNIRFVDQRRRLQRVTVTLALHVAMRDAPNFVVDERRQPVERGFVTLRPFDQQSGQVIRSKRVHPREF